VTRQSQGAVPDSAECGGVMLVVLDDDSYGDARVYKNVLIP
jgi:hypothetical protein